MIGHQSLINLRLDGYKPAAVFVMCCDKVPTFTSSFDHPDRQLERGALPEILILPDEAAATLDLRVLHGLMVHINAKALERGEEVMRRAAEFAPSKILCSSERDLLGWKPDTGFVRFKI